MSRVACRDGSWTDPVSRRRMSYRMWSPPDARALAVIVHGFGEHGGRYQTVAEQLAEQRIAVAVPDLWGHGRSEGPRGDLAAPAECVRVLRALTDTVWLPESGQASYALFGHSFGGLLAIAWALEAPPRLRRLIVQSPLLEAGFPIPAWKTSAALFLARWCPGVPFSMNLDLTGLSRDPNVIEAYRSDPLVHNRMTAGTYRAVVQLRDAAFTRTGSFRVPVLLLCGSADRIVSIAAARLWFSRLRCEKRRVTFPDCCHELHHEPARDEVIRLIRDWILTNG